MADPVHTTRSQPEPISEATATLLRPFFPRWRGDADEPALPAPVAPRPSPALAREADLQRLIAETAHQALALEMA